MGCFFIQWENASFGGQKGFKREETEISRINTEIPGNYFNGQLQTDRSELIVVDLFQVVLIISNWHMFMDFSFAITATSDYTNTVNESQLKTHYTASGPLEPVHTSTFWHLTAPICNM